MERVKLNVTPYKGTEVENLQRWKVEVTTAIEAGGVFLPTNQVAFAMSHLAARAKDWAFGKKMADATVFPNVETFFHLLEEAFQPPKSERRSRIKFLQIRQGSRSLHEYVQEARILIAGISKSPIDNKTQVDVFLEGLADGPVRRELFRADLTSLEEAMQLAQSEEFTLRESRGSKHLRNPRFGFFKRPDPYKMDLSTADAIRKSDMDPKGNKPFIKFDKANVVCWRCNQKGHYQSECRAAPRGNNRARRGGRFQRFPRQGNGRSQ
jgi:retrotransposon gag protein/zinc knuckle protein